MTAALHETRAAAELSLVTMTEVDDDVLSRVAPAVLRAAMETATPPPIGLLVDVAHLLLVPSVRLDLARARATASLPTDDAALRQSVAAAFDAFLVPIATSVAIGDIRDALARHPSEVAAEAAGALAAEIAGRCFSGAHALDAIRFASVRKTLARPAREVLSKGASALAAEDRRAELTRAYGLLAGNARRAGSLVGESDVIVAEGAIHLRTRAARIALRQLADATEAIARRVPTTLMLRKSRGSDVSTRQRDESTYPMGGFSSMSNAGTLENVVSSELALATDGDIAEDLFAVRWAIGELLYYTRDESVALRRRATIVVTLDAALARARVKDREAPWQRIVLAMATIGVFVERALHFLRNDALEIRVAVPSGRELDEEEALLSRALARSVASGRVSIGPATDAQLAEFRDDRRRVSDVLEIRVTTDANAEREVVTLFVGSLPEVSGVDLAHAEMTAVDAWAAACKALLQRLP